MTPGTTSFEGEAADLSFVIPAYNEANNIGRCVHSINEHVPHRLVHEIIVVDHRSTDDTSSVARAAGARVIHCDASTIAGVRNRGVSQARGTFLVFLDADCALSPAWGIHIEPILEALQRAPKDCAGSQVSPPPASGSVLSEHWFVPFTERATHLGSAHFICRRETFLALGGFNERLETGEDYDLGQRFVRAGGRVLIEPRLEVFHYDFPSTLGEFVRRERWHGRGDAMSPGSVLRSKVALASLIFVALIVGSVAAAALGRLVLGAALAASVLALLVASSFTRLRGVPWRTRLYSFGLFAAYYSGRFLALWDGVRGLFRSKRVREAPAQSP